MGNSEIGLSAMESVSKSGLIKGDVAAVHWYRLTRPYSWVCSVFMGTAIWLLAGGTSRWPLVFFPVALSGLLWVGLNWLSERIQCDPGRRPPPWFLVALVILLSATLATTVAVSAGAWALLHYACVVLYAEKKYFRPLGFVSYLVRGATVFSACATIAAAANNSFVPSGNTAWFILAISFAHASRNLVADIRDMGSDAHELPATQSPAVVALVAMCCLLAAALAGSRLDILRNEVAFFVATLLVGIIWLLRYGRAGGYPIAGYFLHQIMILLFSIFAIYCSVRLGLFWGWAAAGTVAVLFFHREYRKTPGKFFYRSFERIKH